jgi:hypothetical protein
MATVVVILNKYSGTTWQIPSDCYGSVTVECIGPGGDWNGYRGGGGGAYTKNTFTLSSANVGKLAYLYWYGNTWLNWNAYAQPTNTTDGVLAAGGGIGIGQNGGIGGQASACIPSTGAFSGGNGSVNSNSSGGAAGPSGVGGSATGDIGGTANGGTVAGGTTGTASANPNRPNTPGSVGLIYTDFFGNRAGPAGGSASTYVDGYGKNTYSVGPSTATSAGGGGPGADGNGLIVITYTSQPTPQGRYVVPIDRTGTNQWRVPDGVTAVKVEALGAGAYAYANGNGAGNAYGTYYNNSGTILIAGCAGGGGAYASNTIKVSQNNILYMNIPSSSTFANSKTWLNTTNAVPTSLATGVIAAGAGTTYYSNLPFAGTYQYTGYGLQSLFLVSSKGGQASDCLGQLAYSGGDGATTYTTSNNTSSGIAIGSYIRFYVANMKQGNAGGGGAAGPNGPGGNGGQGYFQSSSTGLGTLTGASGGAGGGGGANGGSVGGTATSTTGANGGTSLTGTAGGIGTVAYTTTTPTAGSSGSGGGGGSYYRLSSALYTYATGYANANATTYANAVSYTKGGDGSTQTITTWNPPGITTYGPGSGGGGAARLWYDSVSSSNGNIENNGDGMGGSGGKYGGGQGMGGYLFNGSATSTSPGQGLVVIQYTVTTSKATTFLPLFM